MTDKLFSFIKAVVGMFVELFRREAEKPTFKLDMQLFAQKGVELKRATAEQLAELGLNKAQIANFIEHRNSYGINEVSDLLNIKGIGPKTFDSIKDKVYVKEESKVKKNSRGQKFAMKVIKNSIDRRAIRFQCLSISGGTETRYSSGQLNMVADFSSFGMNKITRKMYNSAFKTASNVFVKDGVAHVLNNVVSSDCIKQPFTDEMLELQLAESDSFKASELADQIRNNMLTIQYTMDGEVYVHLEYVAGKGKNAERYFHTWLITGDSDEYFTNQQEIGEIMRKGGVFKRYGCIYAGPSNQRCVTAILFKMTQEEAELSRKDKEAGKVAFNERMTTMFNEMAGGIMTTISEMVEKRGKLPMQKAFKLNSRISLAFTPNTETFKCHSVAIINGSFGNGAADGQYLLNADMLADYYHLDVWTVVGLAIQGRVLTGMIAKGMAIPTLQDGINTYIEDYGMDHEVIRVSYDEYRQLYINNKLVENAMYIVGEGEVGFVFDENTMKCFGSETDWKYEDGFTFSILELRQATEGKLNSQDAACMQHLEGMPEFVKELGKAHIDAELDKIEEIFDGKVSKGIVNPDGFYPDLISKLCPSYAAQDSGLMETIIVDKVNSLVKAINRYSFKLGEGDQYRYLQSDYAEMLTGFRVLKDNEVYIPGMAAGKKVVLTRNPKADCYEQYIATTVDLDEIYARIEALNCSIKMQGTVKCLFKYACGALVITPADPKLPNSLGGSDFDGDGCTVHCNEKYVEIAEKMGDGSNKIPPAAKDNKVVGIASEGEVSVYSKYDINTMQSMMIDGIFGQKDRNTGVRITPTPIGILANHAMLILAMRTLSDSELEIITQNVTIPGVKALDYEGMGAKYERKFNMPDVELGNDDVRKATEAYYNSNLNVESTRAYLDDCARMGASVEGRGIDVNKTAEIVLTGYFGVLSGKDLYGRPIKIKGGKTTVKCCDTIETKAEMKRNNDGNIVLEYTGESRKDTVIYVESKLTPVRRWLFDYLQERINVLFARKVPKSSAETTLLASVGTNKVNAADLTSLATTYAMTIGNSKLQSEDKKNFRRAVANTVRLAFDDDVTIDEKFAAIKRAAYNEKTQKYTSFEHVLREEYVQGILRIAKMEGYEANAQVGYPVVVLDRRFVAEGDEVHMYNGRSLDGNIVADKNISGIWSIAVKGNNVYLARNAVEHFAAPKITNEIIIRGRSFNPAKAVNDFNNVPSICDKDRFARIRVDDFRQALILNAEGSKVWNIYMPTTSKKGEMPKVLDTRLNKMMHSNGMFLDEIFQYTNRFGYVDTVVAGRFVKVDKPLPQIKKNTIAQKKVDSSVLNNMAPATAQQNAPVVEKESQNILCNFAPAKQ